MTLNRLYSSIENIWNQCPNWLQGVAVGLAAGASFLQPTFAPLLLIALPVGWMKIMQAPTVYQAMWFGWLVWYVKSFVVMSWMWSTFPLVWVPLPDAAWLQLSIITFYIGTVSLWLSSAGALIGAGLWYVQYSITIFWRRVALGTIIVVSAELTAAFIFSVANFGPGATLTTGFSYGMIGLPLAALPGAIGWAAVYGLSGLSLLVALYTLGIAWIETSKRACWGGAGLVFVCLGGVGILYVQQKVFIQPPVTIAVIETDFTANLPHTEDSQEKRKIMLQEAFAAAMSSDPGYVLLPEDARFSAQVYPLLTARQIYDYLRLEYNDFDTVVLDSARVETSSGAILRATIYDGVSKTVSQVDKQYLVPQGEYVPYFYRYIFRALGYGAAVATLEKQAYRPGPYVELNNQNTHIPAVLFCFASSHSYGVAEVRKNNTVPFVAHIISHSWFHTPTLFWRHTDQFLRVQAVWNQVPLVSAANMATSKVYHPDGSITVGEVVAAGELWRVRLVTLPQ